MKQLTLRDLRELGDERFEDLVAALVMREYPGADHLGAPDGGADVILDRPDGQPRIWQVKHYPDQVGWDKCVDSLDAAVETYDPSEVVFVFPRRITSRLKKTFRQRLRDRHPDVEVSHVSGSQLEQLAQIQQSALDDRRFDSQVSASIGDTPEPEWDPAPYLVTIAGSPDSPIRVASWASRGADVELPTFMFTNDRAGERSRQEARARLARGEEARLREGVTLRVELPEATKAAAPEPPEGWGEGEFRIRPRTSHELTVSATADGVTVERQLKVFQVPPPRQEEGGRAVSFGGVDRGFEFFMDLALDRRPKVRVNFTVTLDQSASRPELIESARLLLAFLEGAAEMTSDLLPESDERPRPNPEAIDEEQIRWLRAQITLDDALTTIRERTGIEIAVPDPIPVDDIGRAVFVSEVLRSGRGSVQVSSLSGSVPIEESAEFLKRYEATSTARLPLKVPVLGKDIDLGIAEGEVQRPDLVVPGPAADGEKQFEVRWATPTSFEFTIVGQDDGPHV